MGLRVKASAHTSALFLMPRFPTNSTSVHIAGCASCKPFEGSSDDFDIGDYATVDWAFPVALTGEAGQSKPKTADQTGKEEL